MVDAPFGQFAEIAVQADRVGRGQRAGAMPGRRYEAERAEARRRTAESGPSYRRPGIAPAR